MTKEANQTNATGVVEELPNPLPTPTSRPHPFYKASLKPKEPLTLLRASDVEAREVEWLWYPYIPAGMITLLEGEPGVGKSWITCALAADVSRGRLLPGARKPLPPQNVIMLTQEDDLNVTLRPRLEAMGADLDRIYLSDRHFVLDEWGLNALEEQLNAAAAAIVFLDPMTKYLGGKIDMNKANETDEIMGPLVNIAHRTRSAVVAVRHLRKEGGTNRKHAGLGSINFIGTARSTLQVGEDTTGQRYLRQIKINIAKEGRPLAYNIENGTFNWLGEYEFTRDEEHEISRRPRVVDKAKDFLTDFLKNGPQPVIILHEEANRRGISTRALDRAKPGLVISRKNGAEWVWELLERSSEAGQEEPIANSEPQMDANLANLLETMKAKLANKGESANG